MASLMVWIKSLFLSSEYKDLSTVGMQQSMSIFKIPFVCIR